MKYLFSLLAMISMFQSYGQLDGETCATAIVIPQLPYVFAGDFSAKTNDYYSSCESEDISDTAIDQVYAYTNGPEDTYVEISVCQEGIEFFAHVYLYEEDCQGEPIACQLDACDFFKYGTVFNSGINTQLLQANTTYYVVIDGFIDDSERTGYQLNMYKSPGIQAPDSSKLPLVFIDTGGQNILDEPKVTANMKIIHNDSEMINSATDSANVYDGLVGIEIRGSYSATLPQKPFGFETRDDLGHNLNVSLLGMPEENDWILLANFNDKVLFRNLLSFDLYRGMGHYAPRTQLCEVIINDVYNGIYVFTEKIKRDKNRVDIASLNSDENNGDDLTGGYIFRIDYWKSDGSDSWRSSYRNPNYPFSQVRYVYNYPDALDITTEQKTYIQGSVSAFEDALWSNDFTDPIKGYRNYIDVPSFIDYFIVNEFARNVDGFKKSRNFYKNKDSKDSLIYAGPVWDFDWGYKDHEYTQGRGWRHNYSGGSDITPPGWYIRLMQDSTFSKQLADRYFSLRSTTLSTESIFRHIDSLALIVDDAQKRHYTRWPTLGVEVGTPEIGTQPTSYKEEVLKFKNWIDERLIWLDANMPPEADPLPTILDLESEHNLTETEWRIYPNPSKEWFRIEAEKPIQSASIYDTNGHLIVNYHQVNASILEINTTGFSGIYMLIINLSNGQRVTTKFISD